MVSARFVVAGRIARTILNAFGFAAIVSPWRTVYVLGEYLDHTHAHLLRHEMAHLEQMRRDGWWYFWLMICVWFVYPGYERSPYEIEARQAEREP